MAVIMPLMMLWFGISVSAVGFNCGTMSPCLGIGIGMAYVPAERAQPGTELEIDVRGKVRPAEVRTKPLYRKENDG